MIFGSWLIIWKLSKNILPFRGLRTYVFNSRDSKEFSKVLSSNRSEFNNEKTIYCGLFELIM